jgi:hypothetical protein
LITFRFAEDFCIVGQVDPMRFSINIVLLLTLTVWQLSAQSSMHFERQLLADDLAGGYQVIACDVNADGKPDLVALSSNLRDLLWFENPGWQRHVLAERLPSLINAACWNKVPGVSPAIAVTYGFSMKPQESPGIVSILQSQEDPRKPWKVREIDRLPTSHRLRWADVDGSGNKVLVNAPLAGSASVPPEYRSHVPLVYYKPGEWKRRLISEAEDGIVHGIFVNDWDHKGKDCLLICGFEGIHLYRYSGLDHWSRSEIATGSPRPWPKSGTSDVTVGKLGRERFLAAIEPWHGNELAVYRRHEDSWQREVIDDTLLDGHNVGAGDFDNDGNDEIVAGFRGKPFGVYLYQWSHSHWEKHVVESGEVSAAGCALADLDANGRLAIICIGQATHNLEIYRLTH